MRSYDIPTFPRSAHRTYLVTAGGWARSGKGTSMSHLKDELERCDQRVVLIDQGIKFRAMAEVALAGRQISNSPTTLNDFISSKESHAATLRVLAEVAEMDEKSRKERFYTTELSKAAGKVGTVPSAHKVAVGLLRSQVETAVEDKTDIVIIDGRSMEKYARQFTNEKVATFVMGWFFKCDPAIAARRSLGIFDDYEGLNDGNKSQLLAEILGISDRNRSDTLRSVDPLTEPTAALHINLRTYDTEESDVPYKQAFQIINREEVAVVDTSYTSTIAEMTTPVTYLTKLGLMFQGPLDHSHVGM